MMMSFIHYDDVIMMMSFIHYDDVKGYALYTYRLGWGNLVTCNSVNVANF